MVPETVGSKGQARLQSFSESMCNVYGVLCQKGLETLSTWQSTPLRWVLTAYYDGCWMINIADWALILNKYFPVNGLQEANTLISQLNNKPWLNAFDFIHLFLKRPSCICRAEQDCQFWKNKNKVGLMWAWTIIATTTILTYFLHRNGDELQLEKEFQHLIVNNLGYIG